MFARDARHAGSTPKSTAVANAGRQFDRPRRAQIRDDGFGEQDTQRACTHREQQRFGEHLTRDAPAARSERRANRELALAHERAAEQQVRDVDARYQKYGGNGAEQGP